MEGASAEEIIQSRIIALQSAERTLDGPPKVIHLRHLSPTTQYGIQQIYMANYAACQDLVTEDKCQIDLNGTTAYCDVTAFLAIKALILTGISKDPDLSIACCSMFKKMIGTMSQETTTGMLITTKSLEDFVSTFKPTTYVGNCLINGIRISAFPQKYLTIYWRQIAFCGKGLYEAAIKAGEEYLSAHQEISNETGLAKVLNDAYAEAKKDPHFMACLAPGVPTKPLIGMMYLTCAKHSDVFNLKSSSNDGFM